MTIYAFSLIFIEIYHDSLQQNIYDIHEFWCKIDIRCLPFGVITAVLYPIAFHPFILVQYITEVGLQNSAEKAASFYFI